MKHELISAANFIVHLLRLNKQNVCCEPQLNQFKKNLIEEMRKQYYNHWFPHHPFLKSNFRTIFLIEKSTKKLDPILQQAGKKTGLPKAFLTKIFPEVILFINPFEVCYRFGENGSLCVLYDINCLHPWVPLTYFT
jgi:hypothetical protein